MHHKTAQRNLGRLCLKTGCDVNLECKVVNGFRQGGIAISVKRTEANAVIKHVDIFEPENIVELNATFIKALFHRLYRYTLVGILISKISITDILHDGELRPEVLAVCTGNSPKIMVEEKVPKLIGCKFIESHRLEIIADDEIVEQC